MAATHIALDKLEAATRNLELNWEMATEVWRDKVKREFEKQHYVPLQQEHQRITQRAELLVQTLQSARRTIR